MSDDGPDTERKPLRPLARLRLLNRLRLTAIRAGALEASDDMDDAAAESLSETREAALVAGCPECDVDDAILDGLEQGRAMGYPANEDEDEDEDEELDTCA